jgi:hypothetical protein
MTADSSTGGPLLPMAGDPLEDDALDDFLQGFVVGITGMAGTLIYPRYQDEPPNLPDWGIDWAAIGVVQRTGDTYAVEEHASDGVSYVTRHETLDIACTFYGPHCQTNAARLRDGLGLAQNRELLMANGMGLVSVADLQRGGDLVKMRWLQTSELPFAIRRIVVRSYDIRDVVSLDATVQTEDLTVVLDGVTPPPAPGGHS